MYNKKGTKQVKRAHKEEKMAEDGMARMEIRFQKSFKTLAQLFQVFFLNS